MSLGGDNISDSSRPALRSVVAGAVLGLLVELPAVLAAIISSGAGHGDYFAARALFPLPMLLTLVEGSIGVLSITLILLQFPIYGVLLGWARVRNAGLPVLVVALLHLGATIACFTGMLPNFS